MFASALISTCVHFDRLAKSLLVTECYLVTDCEIEMSRGTVQITKYSCKVYQNYSRKRLTETSTAMHETSDSHWEFNADQCRMVWRPNCGSRHGD